MDHSDTFRDDLLPEHSAPQHERAPRPLPLFLELVRSASERDRQVARDALAGLRAYENAERESRAETKPRVAQMRGACLRDYGGTGPIAVLIPSLINPPRILHLDDQVSLAAAISKMGRSTLLVDWGSASDRSDLSVAGHVEELLLPLLRSIAMPTALVGYCLGGTMAIAAANQIETERVVTLAAPWYFSRYPDESRTALQAMWEHSEAASRELGALPMEVLQASFWSLDPHRIVSKFAEFGRLDPHCPTARRFVELEDWANEGEPLPYPSAKELMENMFALDQPGSGVWNVGGSLITDRVAVPRLHLTAEQDRIAPPATAPEGQTIGIASGHVGMIVGSARHQLHDALRNFIGTEG